MNEKQRLRSEITGRIGSISPDERIVLDAQIATHITHLSAWREATAVFAWVAMSDEVDLQSVLRAARAEGKQVGLPRVEGRDLRFCTVDAIPGSLERHRMGFLQPSADAATIAADAATLVLVPGRAFDRAGRRLGRGGGFYDRYLAGPGVAAQTAGVSYAVQLVAQVPADESDTPVHLVVTERETCFCRRSR